MKMVHMGNNKSLANLASTNKIVPSYGVVIVMPAGSRSDPIGESELKSGARDYLYYIYILYCTGTLIDLFFLRVVPVPVVYKQFL